jgi:hypothetical protein
MRFLFIFFIISTSFAQEGERINPYSPPPLVESTGHRAEDLVAVLENVHKQHELAHQEDQLARYEDAQRALSMHLLEGRTAPDMTEHPCEFPLVDFCTGNRNEVVEHILDDERFRQRIQKLSAAIKVAFLALADFSTLEAHLKVSGALADKSSMEWLDCLTMAKVQRALVIIKNKPTIPRIQFLTLMGNTFLLLTALVGGIYSERVMLMFADHPHIGASILSGALLSAWG